MARNLIPINYRDDIDFGMARFIINKSKIYSILIVKFKFLSYIRIYQHLYYISICRQVLHATSYMLSCFASAA